tara:strand:+ start:999 stop:1400 length:402 start_codon:yes stop_codon:yes gene_type:complete
MAVVSGLGGIVTGVTLTTNVTTWSINITAESIDTTGLTSTGAYRTRIGGMKDWSGSYTALVDHTTLAAHQTDIGNVIATATFELDDPTGVDSNSKCSGAIVVTDVAITATLDSAVECVFSFDGAGVLTLSNGS